MRHAATWRRRPGGLTDSGLVLILAAVVGLAPPAAAAGPVEDARYRELRQVVQRNAGHAHGTRGMNMSTVIALRGCVTGADLPALTRMLRDRDHVVQLAAARVLTDLGPAGVDALRRARTQAHDPRARGVIDDALWYRGRPEHRPLREHPLTPAERQRIRGCAPGS